MSTKNTEPKATPKSITDLEKYKIELEKSRATARQWVENSLKLEGIVAYLMQKEEK